jgi:hypothetical protein
MTSYFEVVKKRKFFAALTLAETGWQGLTRLNAKALRQAGGASYNRPSHHPAQRDP